MSIVQEILHNSGKDTFRDTLEDMVTMKICLIVNYERKERVILSE